MNDGELRAILGDITTVLERVAQRNEAMIHEREKDREFFAAIREALSSPSAGKATCTACGGNDHHTDWCPSMLAGRSIEAVDGPGTTESNSVLRRKAAQRGEPDPFAPDEGMTESISHEPVVPDVGTDTERLALIIKAWGNTVTEPESDQKFLLRMLWEKEALQEAAHGSASGEPHPTAADVISELNDIIEHMTQDRLYANSLLARLPRRGRQGDE